MAEAVTGEVDESDNTVEEGVIVLPSFKFDDIADRSGATAVTLVDKGRG